MAQYQINIDSTILHQLLKVAQYKIGSRLADGPVSDIREAVPRRAPGNAFRSDDVFLNQLITTLVFSGMFS
jgi:hypothetical protein